jgi:hypothetical protein
LVVVYPEVSVEQQPTCPPGHEEVSIPRSDPVHAFDTADSFDVERFEYSKQTETPPTVTAHASDDPWGDPPPEALFWPQADTVPITDRATL